MPARSKLRSAPLETALLPKHNFTSKRSLDFSGGGLPTDIGYTGQRLDATGLMFYQARYYSSYLNRWIQPDSIVPDPQNPQSLNRYTYANNNPVKYTDPTGHCSETDGKYNNVFDCTVEMFAAMSWQQRMDWVGQFSQETMVDKFKNIVGIIGYFRDDPIFNGSAWAKMADGGVLYAIEHGYNRSAKNADSTSCGGNGFCETASGNWQDFFDTFFSRGYNDAYSKWGVAESAGTKYGEDLAAPLKGKASIEEQIQIDTFIGWGDRYRDIVSNNFCGASRCAGLLDPGSDASGGFVYFFSRDVVGAASKAAFGITVGTANMLRGLGVRVDESNLYANQ